MYEEDFTESKQEKKKFVITRGMLILAVLILIVIVVVITLLVSGKKKRKTLSVSDYKKLEERMVEEAPIYVEQKSILLTEEELKIDLKDLLIENGGGINKDKVKAAKECTGYLIVYKKETEVYKSYIKCGNKYTTSGYVANDKTTSTTTKSADKEKPNIVLKGNSTVEIYEGDTYTDEGATATDNHDGDITSQIKVDGTYDTKKEGEYVLTYTVSDKAGNKASVKRTIVVKKKNVTTTTTTKPVTTPPKTTTTRTTTRVTTKQKTAPIITLYGEKLVNLSLGNAYNEPGYSAKDCDNRDITSHVTISGKVNVFVSGTYQLTYTVTDSYGNTAITTRTIKVKSNDIEVTGITLTPNSLTIKINESKRLSVNISPTNATNKNVTWSVKDSSIVTVSQDGTVYARSIGSTTITVRTSNGFTAKSKVTVKR